MTFATIPKHLFSDRLNDGLTVEKNAITDTLTVERLLVERNASVTENVFMSFSNNLKVMIERKGVSLKAVSEATGIPRSNISDWLSGAEPRLNDSILSLAKYLGCSIDYLVSGKEPEEDLVKEIAKEIEGKFTEIHSGVYRFKVEKLINGRGEK